LSLSHINISCVQLYYKYTGGFIADYEKLGLRIRERRIELKLSQEKLAEMADISLAFIGQIERTDRKPSLETVVKIANALKTTVDYCLKDSLEVDNDLQINAILGLVAGKSENAKLAALDIVQALFLHIS
jgi:transcriptional regulator with XRE-family HTH domain